jgi:polyisoprenoid-binding protein YceI
MTNLKPHILFAAILALAIHARASDAQSRPIDLKRSTVTVRVFKSGLFRAFADNHVINAPLADGTVDDSATPSVRLGIEARDMQVLDPGLSPDDRGQVQARMLGAQVLDVDRFPRIVFRSVTVQSTGADRWSVRGELELHGRTRPVAVDVIRSQGHYKGTVSLKQSAFGITPISIVGGTVKVKDEIKIEFDVLAAGQ